MLRTARDAQGGLVLIAAGTLAIGASYASTIALRVAPSWAPWAFVFGAAAMPVGLLVLGAARRGRLPSSLATVFGVVFLVVAGAFAAALAMPAAEGEGARLFLGLPVRTAIVFYGVGFLPLAILPLAYGLTFHSAVLTEDDLARVRESSKK